MYSETELSWRVLRVLEQKASVFLLNGKPANASNINLSKIREKLSDEREPCCCSVVCLIERI